jgi:hypothetical protein
MRKLLIILVLIVSIVNFLYTFGYQGEPMSKVEFLSRTFASVFFGTSSVVLLLLLLLKKKKPSKP